MVLYWNYHTILKKETHRALPFLLDYLISSSLLFRRAVLMPHVLKLMFSRSLNNQLTKLKNSIITNKGKKLSIFICLYIINIRVSKTVTCIRYTMSWNNLNLLKHKTSISSFLIQIPLNVLEIKKIQQSHGYKCLTA